MMDRKKIEEILKKNRIYLQKHFFVERIGMFGSYIRGDQTAESDIDLIVEFNGPVGWKFFTLKEFLEKKLGKRVDLGTIDALRDEMRDEILTDVIYL